MVETSTELLKLNQTRRITACTRAGPCSKKLDCYVYATRSTTRRLTAEELLSQMFYILKSYEVQWNILEV